MQAVAGNTPSRPFRPPIHGDSRMDVEWLLWKGSSHSRADPFIDTHLKQSMAPRGYSPLIYRMGCAKKLQYLPVPMRKTSPRNAIPQKCSFNSMIPDVVSGSINPVDQSI